MARFVLVHAGWHGGWCWWKLAPLLRAAGHEVYTPTYTGLGERAHLAHPDIDLDTHITDIANVLEFEELTDVILVGHAYAGMILPGVADRAPGRLRHLVYLDAFAPAAGESMVALIPRADAEREFRAAADAHGGGWRVPPPDPVAFGITDEDDLRRMRAHLVAHPFQSALQPLRLAHPVGAGLPRTYIYCAAKAVPDSFTSAAARVRDDPSWRYRELAAGHHSFVTHPRETADLLLEVAALP